MADTPPAIPPDVAANLEGILRERPAAPAGERIGRYIRTERLGAGGMGEVWKAWDDELGRWVALKFLRDEAMPERTRFEREARTVAQLRHPNIAAVYETSATADGRPFIAMQFVDGPTLQHLPRADRRLLVELIRDAALAVHHAHGQGVVHRDLKPANLMVEGRRVYVMDFGLARQMDADASLSASGAVVGTPAYMSPEQATGKRHDVGARSDVYSLGATLYELLTGHPPFGGSAAQVLRLVETAEPPPPRVNRDLDTIVLHCLEKDPARRYPSAQALADDLGRYLRDEPILARPPSVAYRFQSFARRRKALVATAAVTALAMSIAVVALWALTPGTLTVRVEPAGARVTIDGRTWTAPAEIRLAAGFYALRVEADDHDPETRDVRVERGVARDVSLTLRHHRGTLEADALPAAAEIEVDGIAYGPRVRNLALDTGPHRVRAWAPGHFVQERMVAVRRDQIARVHLALDEGVVWGELDASGRGIAALPDLDGDGAAEFAQATASALVIRSGRTRDILWQVPSGAMAQWSVLEPGLLLFVGDEPASLWARCVRLRPQGAHEIVWSWSTPQSETSAAGLPYCVIAGDVALAGRDGRLRILDGRTGALRIDAPMGIVGVLHPAGEGLVFAVNDGRALRFGRAGRDGRIAFERTLAGAEFVGILRERVVWRTSSEWGVDESRRPAPPMEWATAVELDGSVHLVGARDGRLMALGQGGWEHAIADLGPQNLPAQPIRFVPGAGLLLVLRDGVALVDAKTGGRLWTVKAHAQNVLPAGDEFLIAIAGEGLRCVDRAGRTRWTLKLDPDAQPAALLPDTDGDGYDEILLSAFAAWTGVARPPRTIWRLKETPPLRATPAVADPDVLVMTHVSGAPQRGRVVCVDAATGTRRWDREIAALSTRGPAVGDWDGDGRPDLAHAGQHEAAGEFVVTVLRGRDGSELFRAAQPAREMAHAYAVPAIADLNGDGHPDFVTSRWHHRDVWAVDGRTGSTLWNSHTGGPNMGGVAVADFNRDGHPDVVAPSTDGHAYALRGRDGERLWAAPIGENGSRSPPALFDLTGDDTPEVLVVTYAGRLCVIDGRTGAMLWDRARGAEGLGRPSVARTGGRTLIAAPMGSSGTAVFDWEKRAVLWNGPRDWTVLASPAIADLDGDGRHEVVSAAIRFDGGRAVESALLVADLESGAALWRVPMGACELEADPVVADLDGDGVKDVLVATHEGAVVALSGRATIAARRRAR